VYGAAMYSRIMFVHCPSRLGSAAALLTAELQCREGVFATLACERRQAAHHLDGVMSHSFKSSPLPGYDSEPKLPPATRHYRCQSALKQFGVGNSLEMLT
jgi:hypothetical protein